MEVTRVDPSNVWRRFPYFIRCWHCGGELQGPTAEAVAREANREGWRYCVEEDLFLCPDCLRKEGHEPEGAAEK